MNEKTFIGLQAVLMECKRRGYTEVWLNHPNPHWKGHEDGAIVAAPRRKHGGSPAVWDLHYDPVIRGVLGNMSCGNGLADADEAQYNDMSKNIPPSYYKLVNDEWLSKEELT